MNPRIRIRSPLRCDGVGRLDCAEDTESGARLAVRWLPLDANGDAAVRASAKLPEHPTLPRVRQTGQVGDKAFLAMEFPDGQLLSTLLGQALEADVLIEMGAQLADALATVHSQAVVHGEMSAESVLLANGKAFLWDMPLVIANRLADRRGEERLMHQLVRTAPFLAPERARGGAPTAEGDVYALAAVICHAAGAPLPTLGTTLSVVHAVVTGEWSVQVPTTFQEPYRVLLSRMLSREPNKRPTAREAADLLGKPTVGHPTIPELAAVVLPIHRNPVLVPPPVLRMPTKATFVAPPGALEPMLPTKAVADAVAKIPSKPLPITVPTKVEPTVKVSVPEQVLAALSHPIPLDAELKAAGEVLKRSNTLEIALRREKTPPPMVVERKTPAPGVAPTLSEVKSALGDSKSDLKSGKTPIPVALAPEHKSGKTPIPVALAPELKSGKTPVPTLEKKTPAPAIAPTFAELKQALEKKTPAPAQSPRAAEVKTVLDSAASAAITAPTPPPVSRVRELTPPPVLKPAEEVEPSTAMTTEPAKAPSVDLTDSVAVTAETHLAGAEALSSAEADEIELLPRAKPTFLVAAALLAVLTLGLAVGARAMVHHHVTTLPPVAATEEPLLLPELELDSAPAADLDLAEPRGPQGEEDELSALPQAPRAIVRPKPATRRPASPSRLEGKYDSHNEPPAPADDFSFLGSGEEAPKEALKRPSF